MLMAIENSNNEDAGSELNDEEAEVDLEGELVSALEEIDRLRRKKRKQKQLLMKYAKNYSEPSEALTLLRVELEEVNKIEDILKHELTEKGRRCEELEKEVLAVRKELEKSQTLYHQNLSSIKAT